jgi:hypothetical protein
MDLKMRNYLEYERIDWVFNIVLIFSIALLVFSVFMYFYADYDDLGGAYLVNLNVEQVNVEFVYET